MSKLEVRKLKKEYEKKQVLKDINFTVEDGTVLTLLGPSGCGKSTTLKAIAGLIDEIDGEILLDGQSVNNVAIEKRGTVIVFQNHLLFPHLTVEQNIGFGLKMNGRPKKEIKQKVAELLELVKLPNVEQKMPSELSGGQQQRIALARALAIDPKVLLLDEPFSSLDTKLREEMRELTLSIQRQKKITMILVTHDKEEAMMCSDYIAVMLDGEIKQLGTPREIYYHPNCQYVADFMGDKNYIPGTIKENEFISSIGKWKVDHDELENALWMIRPEDIEFTTNESDFVGTIVDAKFAGERIFYKLDVNGLILKTVQSAINIVNLGDQVNFTFSTEEPIIF